MTDFVGDPPEVFRANLDTFLAPYRLEAVADQYMELIGSARNR